MRQNLFTVCCLVASMHFLVYSYQQQSTVNLQYMPIKLYFLSLSSLGGWGRGGGCSGPVDVWQRWSTLILHTRVQCLYVILYLPPPKCDVTCTLILSALQNSCCIHCFIIHYVESDTVHFKRTTLLWADPHWLCAAVCMDSGFCWQNQIENMTVYFSMTWPAIRDLSDDIYYITVNEISRSRSWAAPAKAIGYSPFSGQGIRTVHHRANHAFGAMYK